MRKKYLVLGGNGFIGGALVRKLVANGEHVRVMDRSCPNEKRLGDILDKIEYIEKDFSSEPDISKILDGITDIFHCVTATYPGDADGNPTFDIEANVIGMVKFLQRLVPYFNDIRLFFLSSGGAVYGHPSSLPIAEDNHTNPISAYGVSKVTIENFLHMYKVQYGLDYVVFRISNPYGNTQSLSSGFGAIAVFTHNIVRDKEIEIWGDGSSIRDYIHVDDVADVMVQASRSECLNHHIYNIGSGEGKSLIEVIGIIESLFRKKAIISYKPDRPFDVTSNYLDISRICTDTGWGPSISLERGILDVGGLYETPTPNLTGPK